MNTTGLNIIKTLGCMTAVTFFTIYNTWDRYDYDYHWILGFLTFISTIATPLFFVVAGYLDAQSRHSTSWQMGKIKSVVIVFLFWMTIYYLWEPYQRGYLIQPWFVFAFIVIYTFHPLIEWLSQRRRIFFSVVFVLLLFSYGYDLLAALYPNVHALTLAPQYRLWTWLLFYLTGQLFSDPLVVRWLNRDKVVKAAMFAIPFIYLFHLVLRAPFLFRSVQGRQKCIHSHRFANLYSGGRAGYCGQRRPFPKNSEFKESILAAISKTMTGVYILHYSIFHLLSTLIPIGSLSTKLMLIALTFIVSVLISMLALSNSVAKKVITL